MAKRKIKGERPNFRIIGDFNGLGGRMANLKHKDILHRGKDLVRKTRANGYDAGMRMSCLSSLTGMTMEDLATFVYMGLIRVDANSADPMVMIEDFLALVQRALDLKRGGEIG